MNIQEQLLNNRLLSEAQYYNTKPRTGNLVGFYSQRDLLTGLTQINYGSGTVQANNISAQGTPFNASFPLSQVSRLAGFVDARPA